MRAKAMDELRELFFVVADICDSGECTKMDDGADTRYDGRTYGQALQHAYRKALSTEPSSSWYDDQAGIASTRLALTAEITRPEYTSHRLLIERLRVIGPMEKSREAMAALHGAGFRMIRTGSYTDEHIFPKCDDRRFLFIAEREAVPTCPAVDFADRLLEFHKDEARKESQSE